MKKVLLSFLLFISIILNYQIIFALDNLGYTNETLEQKDILEDLLIKRSNLWNQMFNSKINKYELINKLEEIIAEPLLSYDKKVFTDLCTNNTNMDIVKDIKIEKIWKLNKNENSTEFNARIRWEMENLEGEYQEVLDYRFLLIFEGNKWKIKDYVIID